MPQFDIALSCGWKHLKWEGRLRGVSGASRTVLRMVMQYSSSWKYTALTTMFCSTTTTFIHPMGEAVEAKYDPSQALYCHPCVRISTYFLVSCTYNVCRRHNSCIYTCAWGNLRHLRCPKLTYQWMLWGSMNGCYGCGEVGEVSVMYDASIELVRYSRPLCPMGYVLNQC